MNVTKANWLSAYSTFITHLSSPACQFVSIDGEMTGISLGKGSSPSSREAQTDSPSIRYQKMRTIASKFNLIQIGLCLFLKSPPGSPSLYEAMPFNIYLFPSSGEVVMEVSAIEFNKSSKMNFNEWIYGGIPYCRADQAEEIEKKLESIASNNGGSNFSSSNAKRQITLEKPEDIAFVEEEKRRFEEFLGSNQREFKFREANSFLRLALRQFLEKSYPDLLQGPDALIIESKAVNQWKAELHILRLNAAEREARIERLQNEKIANYRTQVGFRALFQELINRKIPLVTHNGLFDLLFLYSHVEAELPPSIFEFKEKFRTLFPICFDTKWLVSQEPFKWKEEKLSETNRNDNKTVETEEGEIPMSAVPVKVPRFKEISLGELYSALRKEEKVQSETDGATPTVRFPVEFQRYAAGFELDTPTAAAAPADSAGAGSLFATPVAQDFSHEAGFDAFMTGYCFVRMSMEYPLLESTSRDSDREAAMEEDTDSSMASPSPATSSPPPVPASLKGFANTIPLWRSPLAFDFTADIDPIAEPQFTQDVLFLNDLPPEFSYEETMAGLSTLLGEEEDGKFSWKLISSEFESFPQAMIVLRRRETPWLMDLKDWIDSAPFGESAKVVRCQDFEAEQRSKAIEAQLAAQALAQAQSNAGGERKRNQNQTPGKNGHSRKKFNNKQ